MDDHSKRAHSGSVPTCFPAITMTVSARTVAAALSLPNIQTPEEHDKATKVVNEFLNYIRPGHNVLSDFRKDLPREYWETRPLPGKPARMGVFFRDAFFQTTAPKVASVAVRTLGDVFRKTNMVPIVRQLDAGAKSTVSHIEAQSILASADHEVVTDAKEIKDATVHLNMLPSQEMIRSLPQLPADLNDEGLAAWLFELDLAELT